MSVQGNINHEHAMIKTIGIQQFGLFESRMFPAVAKQVSQVLGNSLVEPNALLDESPMLNVLTLMLEKPKTWFWQHRTYFTSEYSLKDIFTSPTTPTDLQGCLLEPAELITNYNYASNFKVSGSMGGELAKLFSVQLKGDDYLHLESPLGKVMSQRVNMPELNAFLANRRVNMDSSLVRQVQQNGHYILCIVSEIVYIHDAATISLTAGWDVTANGDTSLPQAMNLSVNASTNVSQDKKLILNLNAGTRLCYRVHPLEISPDGRVQVLSLFDGDVSSISKKYGSFIFDMSSSDVSAGKQEEGGSCANHAVPTLCLANPVVRELGQLRYLRANAAVSKIVAFILKCDVTRLKAVADALKHIHTDNSLALSADMQTLLGPFLNYFKLSSDVASVDSHLLIGVITLMEALLELPDEVYAFFISSLTSLSGHDVLYTFFIFYDLVRGIPLEQNNDGKVLLRQLSAGGKQLCELMGVTDDRTDVDIDKLLHRPQFPPLLLSIFGLRFDVPILF